MPRGVYLFVARARTLSAGGALAAGRTEGAAPRRADRRTEMESNRPSSGDVGVVGSRAAAQDTAEGKEADCSEHTRKTETRTDRDRTERSTVRGTECMASLTRRHRRREQARDGGREVRPLTSSFTPPLSLSDYRNIEGTERKETGNYDHDDKIVSDSDREGERDRGNKGRRIDDSQRCTYFDGENSLQPLSLPEPK